MSVFFVLSNFLNTLPANAISPDTGDFFLSIQNIVFKKDDIFSVVFSYTNTTKKKLNITSTNQNYFTPSPLFRGQITQFEIGLHENAVIVDVACEQILTWTVSYNGTDKKADAKTPRCGTTGTNLNNFYGCTNTKGWIEDTASRKDGYTKYYWVTKSTNVKAEQTPLTNPELYIYKSCTSLKRAHYLENGIWKDINNQIITSTDRNYAYTNTGNSYHVYFAYNPNNGFRFVAEDENEIVVDSVSLADTKLSQAVAPVMQDNTITYPEILPNVDLRYSLNNEGFSKEIVIKSQTGLQNNLSSFSFHLVNLILSKKSEVKDEITSSLANNKVTITSDSAALYLDTISTLKTNEITSISTPTEKKKKEIVAKVAKLQSEALKNLKQNTITRKLNDKQISTEKDRINNLVTDTDSVTTNIPNIGVSIPFFYAKDDTTSSLISFKVSDDGKTFTILPDQDILNQTKKFPLIIDPGITNYKNDVRDTWVSLNYPDSVRGVNNEFQLTVGGNSYNGANSYDSNANVSRTFLSFANPVNAGNTVSRAQLHLFEYSNNGGGFVANIGVPCSDFDERWISWNRQPGWCGQIANTWIDGGWNTWSNSENIAAAIPTNGNRIVLMVKDSTEGLEVARNGNFCSKDYWAYDWSTKCGDLNKTPYLDITYNTLPSTSTAVDNSLSLNSQWGKGDLVTSCDMSINPNAANCNFEQSVNYRIGGLNDGEQPCDPSHVLGYANQADASFRPYGNYWYNKIDDWSGVCGTKDFTKTNPNGEYLWASLSKDELGATSKVWSNVKSFIVDSSAPIKTSSINAPSFGRADNTKFASPTFTDNSSSQVYVENPNLFNSALAFQYRDANVDKYGNKDKLVITTRSATLGDSARLGAYDYSLANRYANTFVPFDGNYLKLTGDYSKCLQLNNIVNNVRVTTIASCTDATQPDTNRQFTYLPSTGQIQLRNTSICLSLENGDSRNTLDSTQGTRILGVDCNNSLRNQAWDTINITGVRQNLTLNDYNWSNTADALRLRYDASGRAGNSMWTLESNGKLRGLGGKCLDWSGSVATYYPCYTAGTSQNFDYTDNKQLKVKNQNLCLAMNNGVDNATITYAICDGSFRQMWNITATQTTTWPFLRDVNGNDNRLNNISTSSPFLIRFALNINKSIDGGHDARTNNTDALLIGASSYVWDSNYSLNSQKYTYTLDKQIKPIINPNNVCLDTYGTNMSQLVYTTCGTQTSQKWYFATSGEIKSVANMNFCVDAAWGVNTNGNGVYLAPCNGNSSQNWLVDFMGSQAMNPFKYANASLAYNINYRKNYLSTGNASTDKIAGFCTDNSWSRDATITIPTISTCLGTLKDGDTIETRIRSRDRNPTTDYTSTTASVEANISDWTYLGKTVIDTTKPVLTDNSLIIKPFDVNTNPTNQNALNSTDTRISPNNPTSTGKKDGLSISFRFTEANTKDVVVKIIDTKTNTTIRILDRCSLSNNSEKACNNLAQNFSINSENNLSFIWDGKKSDGTVMSDGKYQVLPVITDLTCKRFSPSEAEVAACNTNNPVNGDNFVTIDNSGAAIAISEPSNGAWVNNPNFSLKGGIAGFNNAALEDRDYLSLKICQVTANQACTDINTYSDPTLTDNKLIDSNNIWQYKSSLSSGANSFKFRSTDLSFNIIDRIGDPRPLRDLNQTDATISSWTINYENDAPSLLTTSGNQIVSASPSLQFTIQDTNPNNDSSKVSGLSNLLAKQPAGLDISLVRSYNGTTDFKELPLMKDGVNLTHATDMPYLDTAVCTSPAPNNSTSIYTCTLALKNLQIDGYYKLHIRAKDLAGNAACTGSTSNYVRDIGCQLSDRMNTNTDTLIVKTRTFIALTNNINGSSNATARTTLSGTIERGAKLWITNPQLSTGLAVSFPTTISADIPFNGTEYSASKIVFAGTNYRMMNAGDIVSIRCNGETKDDDNNPLTPTIEICSWNTRINLATNLNQLIIEAQDSVMNLVSNKADITVNAQNVNLISIPDTNYFSPDNDGISETVNFANNLTDTNGIVIPTISGFSAAIKDVSGNLVWQRAETGLSLPSSWSWNGVANTGTLNGQVVPTGDYKYTLSVTRLVAGISTTYTTPTLTINSRKDISGLTTVSIAGLVSTIPGFPYLTSRGIITVKGDAPASSATGAISWNVDICIHAFNEGESDNTFLDAFNCAPPNQLITAPTSTTSNSYSAIITLNGVTTNKYKVAVIARSTTGLELPLISNPTLIVTKVVQLDTKTALKRVEIIENLDGVNSEAKLNALITGTTTINEVKYLRLKTIVSKNTNAVDIDYATYDNASVPTGKDYNALYKADNHIATITNITDPRSSFITGLQDKLNVSGNYIPNPSSEKYNSFASFLSSRGLDSSSLITYAPGTTNPLKTTTIGEVKNSACLQEECEWDFLYPYPSWLNGGIFEIRFKAYKGENTETLTQALRVNGQLPSEPKLLRIDKNSTPVAVLNAIKSSDGTDIYYTNTTSNRIYASTDAGRRVTVRLKNIDTGVITTLADVSDSKKVLNTNSNGLIIDSDGLVGIPLNLTSLVTTLTQFQIIIGTTPTNEQVVGTLVYDTIAPSLNWVETDVNTPYSRICDTRLPASKPLFCTNNTYTNPNATNPWVRSGDAVNYNYQASEYLSDSALITEGFNREAGIRTLPKTLSTSTGTLDCTKFSVSSLSSTDGLGMEYQQCRNAFVTSLDFNAVTTIGNADQRKEGQYFALIFLQDLAGNGVLLSNNSGRAISYQNSINDTTDPIKKSTISTIDTSFTTNSSTGLSQITPSTVITSAQAAIVNGNTITGTQILPTNYPYAISNFNRDNVTTTSGRARSLDFTMFIDNTAPLKQNWNYTNFGQNQKVTDQICQDSTGMILSISTNSIKIPCEVLTDSIGRNISAIANRSDIADGTNADMITPEADRFDATNRYIIRGNTLNVAMYSEKNQRLVVRLISGKNQLVGSSSPNAGIIEKTIFPSVTQQKNCIDPNGNSNISSYSKDTSNPAIIQKSQDMTVLRFTEICETYVSYTLPDDGTQTDQGNALNYYDISFYPMDLAGNTPVPSNTITNSGLATSNAFTNASLRSNSILIYHDTVAPLTPQVTVTTPDSITPVYGDSTTRTSTTYRAITSSPKLQVTNQSEAYSDTEYELYQATNDNLNNNLGIKRPLLGTTSAIYHNDTNQAYTSQFNQVIKNGTTDPANNSSNVLDISTLTATRDDQTAGCTALSNSATANSDTAITNRQIGTCGDGLYTVRMRSIDTAGNKGLWIEKYVERDTVKPNAPIIILSKNGNRLAENLGISISGEANTKVTLDIKNSLGYSVSLHPVLDNTGAYNSMDLIGTLACGIVTYTTLVTLQDRAGNISTSTLSNSIFSDECARCTTAGNGELNAPIKDNYTISGFFKKYQQSDANGVGQNGEVHGGIDLATAAGNPVYAAEDGIAEIVSYGYTDNFGKIWGSDAMNNATNENGGFGNMIAIRNPANGRVTIYGHLENTKIIDQGQTITQGSQIAKVGSTGRSEGYHLHFQVQTTKHDYPELDWNRMNVRDEILVTYPTNPFDYLPILATNLDPSLYLQACSSVSGSATFDPSKTGDSEALPDISENEAKDIVTNYLINKVGWDTNYYGTNPDITVRWTINKTNNNFQALRPTLKLDQPKSNLYMQQLRSIRSTDNSNIGYIGAIIVNPYNKQAYIVKNGTWEKYISNDSLHNKRVLEVVGVPTTEEADAFVPTQSIVARIGGKTQAWWQGYQIGLTQYGSVITNKAKYSNNRIHVYRQFTGPFILGQFAPIGCDTNTNPTCTVLSAYYTARSVADTYYDNNGTSGKYKFPVSDMGDDIFANQTNNTTLCKEEMEVGIIDNCIWTKQQGVGIESLIPITANWINSGDNKSIIPGINPNTRPIKINAVTENDSAKVDKNILNQGKEIYLTIHGWNPDPKSEDASNLSNTYMQDIDTTINSKYQNKIILDVDWGTASSYEKISGTCVVCVDGASKWIYPVAQQVAQRLYDYGLRDLSKVHFIGHSLGTLLSTEIGRVLESYNTMTNKPTLIALEVPNTKNMWWNSGFDIDGSNTGLVQQPATVNTYFKNVFNYSRGIYSTDSWANDDGMIKLTDESYSISYQYFNVIDSHSWVNEIYKQLLDTRNINASIAQTVPSVNSYITQKSNYKGNLKSWGNNAGQIQYLETKVSYNNQIWNQIEGTKQDDKIFLETSDGVNKNVITNSGNDILMYNVGITNNAVIADFSVGSDQFKQNDTLNWDCIVPNDRAALICGTPSLPNNAVAINTISGMSSDYLRAKWDAFKNNANQDIIFNGKKDSTIIFIK